MPSDEAAIRDVVAAWLAASNAGDTAVLADFMDKDVVFLQPGQPPMEGKQNLLDAFEANKSKMRLDCRGKVVEVHVTGDFAFCSTKLNVTAQPLPAGKPVKRNGYALTIFRKPFHGRWVVLRSRLVARGV